MQRDQGNRSSFGTASLFAAACILALTSAGTARAADDDPPLALARDGFFYVGGKSTTVNGKTYVVGQMYVEMRIPAKQTHPYPIIMVHGGTRTGTTFTGTPDGREGWAQYFARRGYAVYVVDQPGRGRSGYLADAYGPQRLADGESGQRRYLQQEKYKLWPQAYLHTQWPGNGEPDDPVTLQMVGSYVPEIEDFTKQQFLNRDALVALLDKIGPSIVLVHSQAGAFGWPVADARPTLVKAIVGVEPNGPPVHGVEFIGAPDWFKEGPVALSYGLSSVPLTYAPAAANASEMSFVKEDKADGPGLVTCWKQKEPARQLINLQKMPIMVLTSEASYHAPYDHCTVTYLQQAGIKPTHIRLAELGLKGNSHVMMQEKNSKEIAAVIAQWLDKALPATQ
jgi:pimeloyl-ACP methyl ester carboxylesterase